MILLDSNIVIYLRDPGWSEGIVKQQKDARLHTCNVIVAEVLGFKGLDEKDTLYFEKFFSVMKNLPFDSTITRKTIEIRKSYAIQLPDAIIAATALTHNLTLWSHNTKDFEKISELKLADPLND